MTIANINGSEVESLTSHGDIDLGGIDFDAKLADLVDHLHEKTHGRTLRAALGIKDQKDENNSTIWQELLLNCEAWKKELSDLNSVFIKFNESPDGKVQGEISRADFEAAISSYLARTEMLVEAALSDANLSPSQIDQVLLVGGSTRIPSVKNSIKKLIGKDPLEAVNVDEVVALGAAIYAGISGDKTTLTPLQRQRLEKLGISEVASHYYGTIALNSEGQRQVFILIQKNQKLPYSITDDSFRTINDGQEFIISRITQSGSDFTDPDLVKIIRELKLGPLPSGRPKGQPLSITFRYTSSERLEICVVDINSNLRVEGEAGTFSSEKPQIKVPSIRIE